MADAGSNQQGLLGELMELDGSGSYDPDGDILTYEWSYVSKPEGSTTKLLSPTHSSSSFSPDKTGKYVISLVVSDGSLDSAADTVKVTITRCNVQFGQIEGYGKKSTLLGFSERPQHIVPYLLSLETRLPKSIYNEL